MFYRVIIRFYYFTIFFFYSNNTFLVKRIRFSVLSNLFYESINNINVQVVSQNKLTRLFRHSYKYNYDRLIEIINKPIIFSPSIKHFNRVSFVC